MLKLSVAPNLFPAAARRAAAAALRNVMAVARAIAHRRDVKRLLELDDRTLKDIGLQRSEVCRALAAPFFRDPSSVLVVRSVERRALRRGPALVRAPTQASPCEAR